MYEKILLINNLNLPDDLNKIILIEYKYNMLEPKYKNQYTDMVKYLQYYIWLNKKMNKKDKSNVSLIKTIKEFDYYNPN
tara:strand:+ start:13391 stop:13627 length:237 start_codon:yes stop_codon:yes gene_type:complete